MSCVFFVFADTFHLINNYITDNGETTCGDMLLTLCFLPLAECQNVSEKRKKKETVRLLHTLSHLHSLQAREIALHSDVPK
jgi:hypothetical protein